MEKTSFLEMAGGILITCCSLDAFLSLFHIVTPLQLDFKSVVFTKFIFARVETSWAQQRSSAGLSWTFHLIVTHVALLSELEKWKNCMF